MCDGDDRNRCLLMDFGAATQSVHNRGHNLPARYKELKLQLAGTRTYALQALREAEMLLEQPLSPSKFKRKRQPLPPMLLVICVSPPLCPFDLMPHNEREVEPNSPNYLILLCQRLAGPARPLLLLEIAQPSLQAAKKERECTQLRKYKVLSCIR